MLLPFLALVAFACSKENAEPAEVQKPEFVNRSVDPLMATILPEFANTVKAYTFISSSDLIPNSPGFIFGGAPDGQVFLKNPDGSGYIVVTNHENTRALSRLYLDKKLNILKGEYIVDIDGGMFRLCSASLATPEFPTKSVCRIPSCSTSTCIPG